MITLPAWFATLLVLIGGTAMLILFWKEITIALDKFTGNLTKDEKEKGPQWWWAFGVAGWAGNEIDKWLKSEAKKRDEKKDSYYGKLEGAKDD